MNSKKRKERKQMITLGILLLVIILLVVVYAAVTNGKDEGEGEGTDSLELMDIGTFNIIEENYALITELSYTYNGNTLSFHIEGGKWVLDEDPDFPLNQEKLVYMSQAISDYGGYRRLTYKEGSEASYGLDDPTYDITATYYDKNGEEKHTRRYYIGDKNTVTGYYYFLEDGADYIYMVNDSLFPYFSYVKSQLFESVTVPSPKMADLHSLRVITEAGEKNVYIPESEAVADENGNITYSPAERIMNVLYQKMKLNYDTNVDYAVTEEERSAYGLDDGAMKIVIDYTEYREVATEEGNSAAKVGYDASFTLLLGGKGTIEKNGTETEIVYVAVDGSDTVYSMAAADYDEIISALSE